MVTGRAIIFICSADLSGNQLLAEADVKIEYGDGCTFNTLEEDKIENEEMNNDSSDKSTDFTMQQTEMSVEKNNKSNLNPSKIMDNNKKQYVSNKKPPILHFNWRNGDLKSKEQFNMPKLQRMDKLGTSFGLFEIYFDDALVMQIVQFTKLYGQREKGDCSFDLSNEKLCLFLGISRPSTFVQAVSDSMS